MSEPAGAANPTTTTATGDRGWEGRIQAGLAVLAVPSDVRSPLVGALGMAGVEAEYFLTLVRSLGERSPDGARAARARGEAFLIALDAAGRRLVTTAGKVEVATQAFLAALVAQSPEVRAAVEATPPWWGALDNARWSGLSVEMDLRRSGYSLRQVTGVRLGEITEALAERMALTLHALATLPPAGVLAVDVLASGLYQLAELWQDDIANGLVRDVSPDYPGLLSAVARLRVSDAADGADLDADIAWARAQVDQARTMQQQGAQRVDGSMVQAAERAQMVGEAVRIWQETLTALEHLRDGTPR